MSQIGRNLTDVVDGILSGNRYLIHDRDPLFTTEFLNLLSETGVKSVRLPPRSPNLNAHAERFVWTIKESCLERMILFGEESLRTAIGNFAAHYSTERNHQGLGDSADPSTGGACWGRRTNPATPTPGWHAELLLSRRLSARCFDRIPFEAAQV
jgi:hypothetical protein